MSYAIWNYVHIVLFVYWLGADLGVMVLGRQVKRPELSFDQRALLLKCAMIIDLMPRIAFIFMFPTGLVMSQRLGLVDTPGWLVVAVWLISAAWFALLLGIGRYEGRPLAARLQHVQRVFLMIVGTGLIGVGLWSLLGTGPFATGWLATKVLLFGVICWVAVGIDWAFEPLMVAFPALAQGSTPELEAQVSKAMDNALRFVYTLYALLAFIAFLGVTKPF